MPAADNLPFGLTDRQREQLQAIFGRHPWVTRVWVFGSRATGKFRPGSDLDLAVEGAATPAEFAALWTALDDLEWILPLDVVHQTSSLPAALRAELAAVGKIFYQRP